MRGSPQNNYDFILKYLPDLFNKNNTKIQAARNQLTDLDEEQRMEWCSILILKSQSLLEQSEKISSQLKECIGVLAHNAHKLSCEHDAKLVEDLLKEIFCRQYTDRSNESTIKAFKKFNFDTAGYETFQYEDPWYTRVYLYFTE